MASWKFHNLAGGFESTKARYNDRQEKAGVAAPAFPPNQTEVLLMNTTEYNIIAADIRNAFFGGTFKMPALSVKEFRQVLALLRAEAVWIRCNL